MEDEISDGVIAWCVRRCGGPRVLEASKKRGEAACRLQSDEEEARGKSFRLDLRFFMRTSGLESGVSVQKRI